MIEPHTHPVGALPASAGGASPFFAVAAAIVLQAEASRRRAAPAQDWSAIRDEHATAYAASEADWSRDGLDEHSPEHIAIQDRAEHARAALNQYQPRNLAELVEYAAELARWLGPYPQEEFGNLAAAVKGLAAPANVVPANAELKPCPFCGSSDLDVKGMSADPHDTLAHGLTPEPEPPPGGWPNEIHHILCNECGAYGPLGLTLNADFTKCVPSAGWNDRAGGRSEQA